MTTREEATRSILQRCIAERDADPAYVAALERQQQLTSGADEARATLLGLKERRQRLDALGSDGPLDEAVDIERARATAMAELTVLNQKLDDEAIPAVRSLKASAEGRIRAGLARQEKRKWLETVALLSACYDSLEATLAIGYASQAFAAGGGTAIGHVDLPKLVDVLRNILTLDREFRRDYPQTFKGIEEG